MSKFEKAQHKAINGLTELAQEGGRLEREAVKKALEEVHEVFCMSYSEVYHKSLALGEELGIDLEP